MKLLRILLKVLAGLLIAIFLFLAVSLAPVDDTPYQQTDYYQQTKQRLTQLNPTVTGKYPIRAGWASANLTPAYTTPTGGYGVRRGKHWETVADSIYVRAIVLDNGTTKAAIVSADLLIIPPTVTEQLKKRLPEVGLHWDKVFMGAIHSHNSIGGWAPGVVGRLFSGEYDEMIVDHITNTILKAIASAQQNIAPVAVGFGQVMAGSLLYNRLNEGNPVDGWFRMLMLQKTTGELALLCTYAGHSTTLDAVQDYKYLSRDYPGVLVDTLAKKTGSFTVFMSGAVGSTGPKAEGETGLDRKQSYALDLASVVLPAIPQITTKPDSTLGIATLPLGLREPNARVLGNWRIRPWLFHDVYGDFPSDLKALRIGNTILVSTPCDFSGELLPEFNAIVKEKQVNLMITSFNGGYVGYITPDAYYNQEAYETQTMNWFGPYNGAYFVEMMKGLIAKM
ncbi:hypothetical protein GCM10023187_49320 [Nibrella viscosa]|uniref:Neutral/alkaline non-lysosomal ceramidase N-terminal domain-containing protein n=1 Tax=Nibrella viscosa TaxID=1084524 RepID=A0ABP8KUS0_9BACT